MTITVDEIPVIKLTPISMEYIRKVRGEMMKDFVGQEELTFFEWRAIDFLLAKVEELTKENRLHNEYCGTTSCDNCVVNKGKLSSLKSENEKMKAVVREAELLPHKMVELMKKNNLKIDNLEQPMQKLAFTFYSEIVELSLKAGQALFKLEKEGK